MISKAEKDRLKAIIGDTIALLCRNSITKFQKDFIVEGLIGITVDSEDLVLVSIKEAVRNPNAPIESSEGSGSEEEVSDSGSNVPSTPSRKRKRKRKKRAEGESSPKAARPGNNNGTDLSLSNTPSTAKPDFQPNASMDNSLSGDGPSNDSSMFQLQEMKHDSDDDDLIEIIKEEPGIYDNQEHIVSIQSLHQNPDMSIMNSSMSSMNSPIPNMMGMGQGMPPGAMPHMPMPPSQLGDLNEQVELMPGSGVYIKRATYNQLQFIDKGSKLVRKLVREIFPDVHLLASSSCMGKGETSAGLDRHKVEVIKVVTSQRFGWSRQETATEINHICAQLRYRLRKQSITPNQAP